MIKFERNVSCHQDLPWTVSKFAAGDLQCDNIRSISDEKKKAVDRLFNSRYCKIQIKIKWSIGLRCLSKFEKAPVYLTWPGQTPRYKCKLIPIFLFVSLDTETEYDRNNDQ